MQCTTPTVGRKLTALCLCVVALNATPAWAAATITNPSDNDSFYKGSNIAGYGSGAEMGKTYEFRIVDGLTVVQEGLASLGGGGYWSATLTPPQGGWPVGSGYEAEILWEDELGLEHVEDEAGPLLFTDL